MSWPLTSPATVATQRSPGGPTGCGSAGRCPPSRASPSSSPRVTTWPCSRAAFRAWPPPTIPTSTWWWSTTAATRLTPRQWYAQNGHGLDLTVSWWDQPFNYSQVNNVAAAGARGDVLVFLNDDTVARRSRLASGDGVVGGAARHRVGRGFSSSTGTAASSTEGSWSGSTASPTTSSRAWSPRPTRSSGRPRGTATCLSVTAACVAVERSLFDRIGGFDERFVLCGSDVVLGLDTHFLGLRNVVTPVRRGPPPGVGDPGLERAVVRLLRQLLAIPEVPAGRRSVLLARPLAATPAPLASAGPDDPGPMPTVGMLLGRDFTVFRQRSDDAESTWLADICRADDSTVEAVQALHARDRGSSRGHDAQLVLPRHRQPVLRRDQHRAAHRRPPGPQPRRPAAGSSSWPTPTRSSSAPRWPPRSRRSPTRP